MKGIIRKFLLCLLAVSTLAVTSIFAAQDRPSVVVGTLLGPDPAFPDDPSAFVAMVEDVRHGTVSYQYIAVRIDEGAWRSHRLAIDALATGKTVELSLLPQGDRGFLAVAVRGISKSLIRRNARSAVHSPDGGTGERRTAGARQPATAEE